METLHGRNHLQMHTNARPWDRFLCVWNTTPNLRRAVRPDQVVSRILGISSLRGGFGLDVQQGGNCVSRSRWIRVWGWTFSFSVAFFLWKKPTIIFPGKLSHKKMESGHTLSIPKREALSNVCSECKFCEKKIDLNESEQKLNCHPPHTPPFCIECDAKWCDAVKCDLFSLAFFACLIGYLVYIIKDLSERPEKSLRCAKIDSLLEDTSITYGWEVANTLVFIITGSRLDEYCGIISYSCANIEMERFRDKYILTTYFYSVLSLIAFTYMQFIVTSYHWGIEVYIDTLRKICLDCTPKFIKCFIALFFTIFFLFVISGCYFLATVAI